MTTTAPAAALRAQRRPAVLPLLCGTALAATAMFLLVHDALIDDAYITMGYARNLALHLHWGVIATETANSATSPLNVLLLGAITAAVRDGVVAVGVLFVAAVVATAAWLDALARHLGVSRLLPVVAVGLLLVNPLLLSTVGLEPYLCAALLAGLLHAGTTGRAARFGLLSGLTVLARPDLGVVVVVAALMFPGVRRRLLPAVGAALVVTLPWYAFSWLALGSALPDTLIMKSGDSTWGGHGFWDGPLLYLGVTPQAAALAFLPIPAGLLVLMGLLAARLTGAWQPWQRTAAVAGLATAAHYGVYCLLHTAPYHWYYAPAIIGMTLCAAIVAARTTSRIAFLGLGTAAALAAVSLAFDVSHGMPWSRAPISTNWATAAQYQRIGEDLRGLVGSSTVESPGEIGTIAYYCDCSIVDPFSDRGRVIGAITAREAASGRLARYLLRLNYRNLDRAQAPRPLDARLHFEAHQAASGPLQWPADHWVAGPGRIVLLLGPG